MKISLLPILVLLVTFGYTVTAATTCDTPQGASCSFSRSGVVENCILQDQNGQSYIADEVIKQLHFDRHGLAQVRSEHDPRHGWMYVNRRGRVVVNGVPSIDNFAEDFSGGLVRTVSDEKYGFANRRGQIVITPAYDWASPFKHGYAAVCNGCREMCALPGGPVEIASVEGGCDHTTIVGGEWLRIDKRGRVVEKLRHCC
jgi:hypothetical protein